ncbi:unnamed protein product [Microthlaspi erraticum]|uniref:Uncharacterized protein n=1 Tax=Microthlaspi erraticum TaxID=1685480 RepID=A0A6D2IYF5_9BRAS|nr:unnamed protein product [Microthlaspi erraticum]
MKDLGNQVYCIKLRETNPNDKFFPSVSTIGNLFCVGSKILDMVVFIEYVVKDDERDNGGSPGRSLSPGRPRIPQYDRYIPTGVQHLMNNAGVHHLNHERRGSPDW